MINLDLDAADEEEASSNESNSYSPLGPKFMRTFALGTFFDTGFALCFPLKLPREQLERINVDNMEFDELLYHSYMDIFSVFGVIYDIATGGLSLFPMDCHMMAAEAVRIGYAKFLTSYNIIHYNDFESFIEHRVGVAMIAIGLVGEITCSYNEYRNQTGLSFIDILGTNLEFIY